MELKLKQRKTNSNKQKVLFCIVALVLLFVGIGYAYLRAQLNFNLSLTIDESLTKKLFYEKIIEDNTWSLDTNVNFPTSDGSSDGSSDPGYYIHSGTENDEYPIYYYRGMQENNNVIFADFCWKIIRTTDTGGIKLQYNRPPVNGICTQNSSSYIPLSSWWSGVVDISDIEALQSEYSTANLGYMFNNKRRIVLKVTTSNFSELDQNILLGDGIEKNGELYILKNTRKLSDGFYNSTTKEYFPYTCLNTTGECTNPVYLYDTYPVSYIVLNGTIEETFEEAFRENTDKNSDTYYNKYDSPVKRVLDTWYEFHLKNYESSLEDTVWCNKKNFKLDTSNPWAPITLIGGNYGNLDLTCPNLIDRFTVSTANGNGDLKYPIGLLTDSEVNLIGNALSGKGEDYYDAAEYLTMTPVTFRPNGFYYFGHWFGGLTWTGDGSNGLKMYDGKVAPAISLKHDVRYTGGDGTRENPYYVN